MNLPTALVICVAMVCLVFIILFGIWEKRQAYEDCMRDWRAELNNGAHCR